MLRSACHGAVKRHVPFSQPGALPRRSKTPFATLGFPHGQYKQIPSFTISISIDVTPGEAYGTGYKAGQACPGTVIMLRSLGGGARRDRTDDLKLAKLPLSQLSYGPGQAPSSDKAVKPRPIMVGLGGLEPPTSRLSSARSNQLSYRPESMRSHYATLEKEKRRRRCSANGP